MKINTNVWGIFFSVFNVHIISLISLKKKRGWTV